MGGKPVYLQPPANAAAGRGFNCRHKILLGDLRAKPKVLLRGLRLALAQVDLAEQ
jgi:hypothetical protein